MLLNQIQDHLALLYETPTDYDIYDFLITDAKLADALTPRGERNNSERLLVSQSDGQLDISVYVDALTLETLGNDDPMIGLHEGNLADFMLALEGVSHFHYLCWNAQYDKSVTLLELELQAEVDKYVTATGLLDAQGNHAKALAMHTRLFEKFQFQQNLKTEHLRRYKEANRYAAKYCKSLDNNFSGANNPSPLVNELRRFYRLTQNEKIRRIENDH